MSEEENLDSQKLKKLIGDYLFTEKIPLRDDIIDTMNTRPSLKERKTKAERITNKVLEFVERFISGITRP
jgi:type I restriction enzyme, R subunit